MNDVIHNETGSTQEYRNLFKGYYEIVWHKHFSNKLGRLAQGVGNKVDVSNTIFFIPNSQVPQDKKVTYRRIVCVIKPQKAETHRTRLTVEVNMIDYPGEFTTPTEDITMAKNLTNSTISTPDSRFVCADISQLYLNTPM